MRKKLFVDVEIPEGVEVSLEENLIKVKGEQGENSRKFKTHGLEFKKRDGKIVIGSEKASKTEKKIMNTIAAHIKNLIRGVQKKFVYEMKICSSHFPMSVDVKGNEAVIKNFLGEKIARKCKIPEGAKVEVSGQKVTIEAIDKEIAGQAAANFETATKITGRDRRIFQDGIYIINKAGKEI